MRKVVGVFLQTMVYNPIFPFEEQENIGQGRDLWCGDWWSIEIGKYFFEGEENYISYDMPRRLVGNKNFSKDKIVQAARIKRDTIEKLKQEAANFSEVAIVETARGLDSLMISSIADWKKIYVYHWTAFPTVSIATEKFLTPLFESKKIELSFINLVNGTEGDFIAISPYKTNEGFLTKAKKVFYNPCFE